MDRAKLKEPEYSLMKEEFINKHGREDGLELFNSLYIKDVPEPEFDYSSKSVEGFLKIDEEFESVITKWERKMSVRKDIVKVLSNDESLQKIRTEMYLKVYRETFNICKRMDISEIKVLSVIIGNALRTLSQQRISPTTQAILNEIIRREDK